MVQFNCVFFFSPVALCLLHIEQVDLDDLSVRGFGKGAHHQQTKHKRLDGLIDFRFLPEKPDENKEDEAREMFKFGRQVIGKLGHNHIVS